MQFSRSELQDLFSQIPVDVLNEKTGMNKSQNAHFTQNKFSRLIRNKETGSMKLLDL